MGAKSEDLWYNRGHLPVREVLVDMPSEQYHSHKALGHTDLLRVAKSPSLFRYHRENPVDSNTKALVIGSATHTAALEPDKFDDEFAIMPAEIEGHGPRSAHYKRQFERIQEERPKVRWLSQGDYDLVMNLAEAAVGHPILRDFLSQPHKAEGSVFFRAHRTLCKARPDLVVYRRGREIDVLDLKTCQDASPGPSGFPRQIATWGYDTQMVFYTKGLETNGFKVNRFIFLAVEKTPPYLTGAYEVNRDSLVTAREIVQKACATYQDCNERDVWPGYGEKIHKVALPGWRSPVPKPTMERKGNWLTVKQISDTFGLSISWIYKRVQYLKERGLETCMMGRRIYINFESFKKHHVDYAKNNSETVNLAKDLKATNAKR
tara:strand:- start:2242 stop:3369 length:1128 start_codon:yes stop_codon:yes gene_type:complete